MTSRGFTFNQPKLPRINNIDKVSLDEYFYINNKDILIPSFPPKTIQEIIRLVAAGKIDTISILEWLDVIENTTQWKQLNTDEVNDACRAIWTAASLNSLLADIAFFKVGLALDGKKSSIHKDLLSSMHIARKVVINYENKEKLDWLISLQSKDWKALALSCVQSFMTPLQRISVLKLPKANEYYQMLPEMLINAVNDPLDKKLDAWLDRCFYSFKTTQERLIFCEEAIKNYDDYGFELKKIIIEHCMPDVDDSFWYDLNESSKLTLKKKFNISNYYELKNISRLICSVDGVEALQLEEHEARQIHSRTMFWSNYSSRFNRIRCLLPQLTYNFIAKTTKKLSSQIEAFSEEKESNYEVYIFELEKIIVVEFLRGGLNETRFFKNNEWNAKRLFESEGLTVDAIREMSQLDVHDHVSSWQYFCEKLLRTKLKVVPDDNLPYFKGLPPSVNQYNSKTGLIKPDFSYLDERSRKLTPWVERFWQDEFKTAKYGNQSDLQKKSNVYLTKAYTARQLGNEEEYQLYLKKSAEQGNSEAMWRLGRSLLLGRGNSPKSRIDGETWIAKAAGKNHYEAVEAAKKYNITALKDDELSCIAKSDSKRIRKIEDLRKEAMSGNYDSMCIYGARLSGRLASSDRKAGLHFLKNALGINKTKTIPFLWEVIEKAKKNKRFDTYLEALDILANIKDAEALIERGSFLSKQTSQISRHKGIDSLYQAAQQNNQKAFDQLWDIVTMSKFKNRIDDYELTLKLLIKLNDSAAKLMLSKHVKDAPLT